jgi:hypothetical protein
MKMTGRVKRPNLNDLNRGKGMIRPANRSQFLNGVLMASRGFFETGQTPKMEMK